MRIHLFAVPLILILLIINACSPKLTKPLEQTTTTIQDSVMVDTTAIEVVAIDTVEEVIEPEIIAPPEPVLPVIMTKLKRESCHGKCPVFEIRIYDDGLVFYNGINHVPRIGWHEAQIDSFTLDKIQRKANEIGYFKMKNTYPSYGQVINDLPTTITYMKAGEAEKTITNHHNSPIHLQRFEAYLDELMDNLKWKWIEKPNRE